MGALILSVLSILLAFNANFAFAEASLTGEEPNLAWAIKAQNSELNYQVSFVNFSSADPKIIIIDRLNFRAPNSRDLILALGQRYQKCVDIKIDDQNKTLVVSPREMFFVQSQHVTNSTYAVNGTKSFSLVTENSTNERYFCVHDASLIKSEWQKKAFLQ